MMGSSHALTGFTTGTWLAAAVSPIAPDGVAMALVPVVAVAALLPDIDHPGSVVTRSLGPVTMAVSWVLRLFVEHRGPTHDVRFAPTAFAVPPTVGAYATLPPDLVGWAWLVGVAVALGVLTHIWGDARTHSGVPWHGRWRRAWWGRTNGGRLRLGRTFTTGSDYERHLRDGLYRRVAVGSVVLAAAVISAGA